MKLDKVIDKILALTKEIKLHEPPNDSGFLRSFVTGKYAPFPGFSMKWWFTDNALEICKDIATMAMNFDPHLKGGDTESFCSIIEEVFEKNALKDEIFSTEFVFERKFGSLFQAIKNKKFAGKRMWEIIHQALTESIINWIILYPLHRIKTPSMPFGYDSISILKADDVNTWEQLCKPYFGATLWDTSTGREKTSDPQGPYFFYKQPETWLVCEVSGTASGARKQAGMKMRTLLSVFFSHLFKTVPFPHLKSKMAEDSFTIYSAQFSNNDRELIAPIGGLIPRFIQDIDVAPTFISELKNWYERRTSAPNEKAQRSTVASHFIHYGIMSDDDLQQFICFFIALDALFGKIKNTEQTIKKGLEQTFPGDKTWGQRAKKLFKLRSKLVHGEASSIEEWTQLERYKQHFKSHPLNDVSIAAMTAFRNYFNLA